jgi:hypothetical protein
MFNTQHRLARTTTTTTTAIAGLFLLTFCLVASPASARPDSGLTAARIDQSHRVLARVGTQYVVGDDLTGNGVPAPAWIREL